MSDPCVTQEIEWRWEEGASYINLTRCVCGSKQFAPETIPEQKAWFAVCEECGRAFYCEVKVEVFESPENRELWRAANAKGEVTG